MHAVAVGELAPAMGSAEHLADIGANLMTNGISTVAEYGNGCE